MVRSSRPTAKTTSTSKIRSTTRTAKAKAAAALTKVASAISGNSEQENPAVSDENNFNAIDDFKIEWLNAPPNSGPYQGRPGAIESRAGSGGIGDANFNFDRLPTALSVAVPDFQSFLNVTDLSNPESFSAAGFKRVTNTQREQDKIAYAEFGNYMGNVADGLSVLIATTQAAIKGAQLGQATVKYATAREGIETELTNLGIQQSKTRQGHSKLDAEISKENHIKTVNTITDDLMFVQVEGLRLTLREQKAKHSNRLQELSALLAPYDQQQQNTKTA